MYGYIGLALALALSLTGNYVQHNRAVALSAIVEKDKAVLSEKLSRAETDATNAARAIERVQADKQAEIAESYEKGKVDAKVAADKFVADLRADNIRLRNRWQGCPSSGVPGTVTSSSQSDAAKRDREESAGRIVRAARECDNQVTGLQAIIRADRGE